MNFPSLFLSYPFCSVEPEWYFRLVLSHFILFNLTPKEIFKPDRFQDACANGFIATLSKDSEYKMSMIHAAYGIVNILHQTLND